MDEPENPGPKPKPSPAQARFWKSGDLEIQKVGLRKISQMKILKIQIRSAQNIGKVWISRKNNIPAPFEANSSNFLHGPKTNPKIANKCLFPLVGQWAQADWLEACLESQIAKTNHSVTA